MHAYALRDLIVLRFWLAGILSFRWLPFGALILCIQWQTKKWPNAMNELCHFIQRISSFISFKMCCNICIRLAKPFLPDVNCILRTVSRASATSAYNTMIMIIIEWIWNNFEVARFYLRLDCNVSMNVCEFHFHRRPSLRRL